MPRVTAAEKSRLAAGRMSATCVGWGPRAREYRLKFRAIAGSEKTRRTLDQPIAIG
jgi:hypothetical protein